MFVFPFLLLLFPETEMLPAIVMTVLLIVRYSIYIYYRRQQIKLLLANGQQKEKDAQNIDGKTKKKNIKKKENTSTSDEKSSANESFSLSLIFFLNEVRAGVNDGKAEISNSLNTFFQFLLFTSGNFIIFTF